MDTGTNSTRFRVEGMDCAACASKVDTTARRIAGVEDVSVSVMNGTMTVRHAPGADLEEICTKVGNLGYPTTPISGAAPKAPEAVTGAHMHGDHDRDDDGPWWRTRKARLTLACGGALVAAYLVGRFLPEVGHWAFLVALLVGLVPIARRAVAGAMGGSPFSIETLMSIAAIGAVIIGATEEAATVVLLFLVGELLEGVAASRARASIKGLADLVPKTALLVDGDDVREVPAAGLELKQVVLVRPGDRIPADGEIVEGTSAIDEAPVTGESVPKTKGPGDIVFAGTINTDTALRITALGRLLREIAVEERLEEIELSPFDEKETQAMVRSLLVPDREVEEAAVSALWKRSDGVPLYLSQLVSSMWARGLFRFSEECWLVDEKTLSELTIPESTRSHFLLLLDEVPTAQRRCLNLAAVIGPSIDFETLLSATGIDEFELDEQCRLLVRSGLLQEEAAGFRWVHGFERDIVLSELTSPMRRRLHARIGRILEEQHDDDLEPYIEAIAEHFTLGGDDAKALGYLVRAADRAEQSYALRRALELIEGALKISRDPTIERELIVRQGDLRMRLGETEQALNVFRQAIGHYTAIEELLLGDEIPADRHDELGAYGQLLQRFGEVQIHGGEYSLALDNFRKAQGIAERVGNNTAVAMALCRQGAANAFDDRLEEAQAAYQSVAEESSDGDGMATARVIALVGLSSISRRLGRLDDALRYCQEALPAAEIVGNPTQIASLWGQFGTLYQNLGRQREAIDAYERSRGLREELGDRRGLAITLMNLGRLHSSAGDFRRGGESLEEALELFQATGDLQGRVLTLGNLGTLHFHRGEFLDARRLLDEYLHLARSHRLRRPEADALHCLGNLELELHHIEDARHLLELSEKGFEEAGDRQGVLSTRVSLSRVLGREENAAAALEEAAATGEEADSLGAQPILSEALRVQAEALRELGNLEGAQEKAQQALRACEEHRLPYSVGVCHRTLAKIYRDRGFEWADRAGASFDRSLAVLEGLGARHAHAVSRREFASFLLLVDETTLAREALEGVETVFSELSSEVELARTRALMEKTSDGT